jgi:hypothetical protein
MDLMQTLGIDIHNLSKMVMWDQLRVLFKPHDYFFQATCSKQLCRTMVGSFDEQDSNEELGYKSKTIKSSLYKQHDPHHVAKQQTHLSTSQRQELAQLLARFPQLFSSKLGCFPDKKVHLELQPDAKPFRCQRTLYLSTMKDVKPAPGRRQTRPNAELESQEAQRETQADAIIQREERLDANGMNNSKASFRIRAYAHS